MSAAVFFVGIDVAKRRLDVHLHPGGAAFTVADDAAGHGEHPARLAAAPVGGVVLEARGGFERAVHAALAAAGLAAAIGNAARVRAFARGLGLLAKTDRIDVGVLARSAATVRPPTTPVAGMARAELAKLLGHRRQLVAETIARTSQRQHDRAAATVARAEAAHHRLARRVAPTSSSACSPTTSGGTCAGHSRRCCSTPGSSPGAGSPPLAPRRWPRSGSRRPPRPRASRRTAVDQPVHGLRTLLADVATLTRKPCAWTPRPLPCSSHRPSSRRSSTASA